MSADFDAEIAQRIKAKGKPGTPEHAVKPSRIEEINARIVELHRQHNELVALGEQFEHGGDDKRHVIETRAQEAVVRALVDMDTFAELLAMEQPTTAREVLILALRALSPVQEITSSVPHGNDYDRTQGQLACRLLRAMIPALEALSGTSRAELGWDDYYYRDPETADELIEGLKIPLTKEAAL